MQFDLEKIINDSQLELQETPEVEVVRKIKEKETGGVTTHWIVTVTFFKGKDTEFTDEYEITDSYLTIVNILHKIEQKSFSNMQDATIAYQHYKPRLIKIGHFLNNLGGCWCLYGVCSLLYQLNPHYSMLVDECWKNIGRWK